jgi:hypothetical protein
MTLIPEEKCSETDDLLDLRDAREVPEPPEPHGAAAARRVLADNGEDHFAQPMGLLVFPRGAARRRRGDSHRHDRAAGARVR